jgi:hypothetical protein
LDRHLAFEDFLAREVLDGVLGLLGSGKVDEGIANGAVGAGIDGNGNTLTIRFVSCDTLMMTEK